MHAMENTCLGVKEGMSFLDRRVLKPKPATLNREQRDLQSKAFQIPALFTFRQRIPFLEARMHLELQKLLRKDL